MKSFLEDIACTILEKESLDSFKNAVVILPSRRAVYYFKKALSIQAKQTFLAPEIWAIDDFICRLSGLQILEELDLIFALKQHYCEIEKEISLELFLPLAKTILKDFDLIDQNLVTDINQLYQFLAEAEAMRRWNIEELHPSNQWSENTNSYFKFYENLFNLYHVFKESLESKNQAYRGMAYRYVAEELDTIVFSEVSYSHYYFVGLNALSKSEEAIIKKLVAAKVATCYWDTDAWFMNNDFQAGDKLRKYKEAGQMEPWNEVYQYLANNPKKISVFECPSDTAQLKLLSKLPITDNTLIILPDENLIRPLLFSIDNQFNITMGVGLGQSKFSALFHSIVQFHLFGFYKSENGLRFQSQYLMNVLSNELVEKYLHRIDPCIGKEIRKLSSFFIEQHKIEHIWKLETDLKKVVFDEMDDLAAWLKELKMLFEHMVLLIREELDELEGEFALQWLILLDKLIVLQKEADFTFPSLLAISREIIKKIKIPFDSDQTAPLQIMSLLESRCLDFRHVIILSANEGSLPSVSKNNSLFPFEILKQLEIPIYADQESIVAYHFFRLMMRAERVDIVYAQNSTDVLGSKKEQSRFIHQIEYLLLPENQNITYTKSKVQFPKVESSESAEKIEFDKNPVALEKIRNFIEKEGVSTSALTKYYQCELKFFLYHIFKLKPEDEIEENIGHNIYGSWIHGVIEEITKEIIGVGQAYDPKKLPEIKRKAQAKIESKISKLKPGIFLHQGMNLIYKKMAEKQINRYFEEYFYQNEPKVVLASEEKFSVFLNSQLLLKGNIDGVELQNRTLNLIDFKTGKVNPEELRNTNKQKDWGVSFKTKDKLRQLLVYKYLIINHLKENSSFANVEIDQINATMLSFRDLSEVISLEQIDDHLMIESVENELMSFYKEVLNEELPIKQTDELKICGMCDFQKICVRT